MGTSGWKHERAHVVGHVDSYLAFGAVSGTVRFHPRKLGVCHCKRVGSHMHHSFVGFHSKGNVVEEVVVLRKVRQFNEVGPPRRAGVLLHCLPSTFWHTL